VRLDRVAGPDALGRHLVRYRQVHAGIVVTAGEVSVHLDGKGVVAVHANRERPARGIAPGGSV
jgi:Zn-dependent metalloprotease